MKEKKQAKYKMTGLTERQRIRSPVTMGSKKAVPRGFPVASGEENRGRVLSRQDAL